MGLVDYLLIRAPHARLNGAAPAKPGAVSWRRIALSLLGLFLGIMASFFVTGLHPVAKVGDAGSVETAVVLPNTDQEADQPALSGEFTWKRFRMVALISLVIVGLTFQGLYYSLRLYQNEPALLVIFVAFQYGYFWQSVVEGARRALG